MPDIKWSDTAEPGSPDDGGNFRRSLQIDMKTLVGDAVGNVSDAFIHSLKRSLHVPAS